VGVEWSGSCQIPSRASTSTLPKHCYAEEMTSEHAHWEHGKHQYTALPYAFPEPHAHLADGFSQLHVGKPSRTRTNPIVSRSRIARHGSQPTAVRPSSSGGEANNMSHRSLATARRAESYSHPAPLDDVRKSRRWPPTGYRRDDALNPEEAEDLICAGASTFKGYLDVIHNAPEGYERFYAVMESEHQSRTDRAPFQQPAYRDMSLNMTGAADSQFPWLSQEQPCMAYAFGKSAGTTTLNYWISKSGSRDPPAKLTEDTRPRKIKFLQILDRLQQLERGLPEDVSPQLCRRSFASLSLTVAARTPKKCTAISTVR